MNRITPLVIVTIFLAVPAAHAQDSEQPGVLVFSQNKCGMDKVDELMAFSEEAFVPLLDEKVSEGELYEYGFLTHAWGDEWNFVIYYRAPSVSAFSQTFNDVTQELQERQPDFMERLASFCTEHKDSIYGVLKTVGPDDVD